MSLVDIAIVSIIVTSVLIGMYRGFIREVLSTTAWLFSLWAAFVYAEPGGEFLEDYIRQEQLRNAAAFLILFVASLFAASMLSRLLRQLFTAGGMEGFDRMLGLVFGAGRGVLVIAGLILVATFMDLASESWWRESHLVDVFTPAADSLLEFLPEGIRLALEPVVEEIDLEAVEDFY